MGQLVGLILALVYLIDSWWSHLFKREGRAKRGHPPFILTSFGSFKSLWGRFYEVMTTLPMNSVVVQDWYQSVPVRSTPTPDPYPHSNRGQTLGTHWSCPIHPLHIWMTHRKSKNASDWKKFYLIFAGASVKEVSGAFWPTIVWTGKLTSSNAETQRPADTCTLSLNWHKMDSG